MRFGEEFLQHPDLFPARLGGERAGDQSIHLDFAGGPYRLSGLTADQRSAVAERFSEVARPEVEGALGVRLRCFRVEGSEFREIDREQWTYNFDMEFEPAAVRLAGWRFMALLVPAPERVEAALWSPPRADSAFRSAYENVLRVALAYRALASGGVLLHSAGIVDEGRSWLFYGPSGAGKSTVSALAQAGGGAVLSDDLNAIWSDGDGWVARQVPHAGDPELADRLDGEYPLGGLFQLGKGREVSATRIGAAEALAALFASSPFVNRDPHRREELMNRLERLVSSVCCGELTFSLNSRFEQIKERLRGVS